MLLFKHSSLFHPVHKTHLYHSAADISVFFQSALSVTSHRAAETAHLFIGAAKNGP